MSVRQVIDRGPLIPRAQPNPVGSEKLIGGKVVFADHTNDGHWLVAGDRYVRDLVDCV